MIGAAFRSRYSQFLPPRSEEVQFVLKAADQWQVVVFAPDSIQLD